MTTRATHADCDVEFVCCFLFRETALYIVVLPLSLPSTQILPTLFPCLISDSKFTDIVSRVGHDILMALSGNPLLASARQEALKTLIGPELAAEIKSCFSKDMPEAKLLLVVLLMLDLKADRVATTGDGNEGEISENGEPKVKSEVIDFSVEEDVEEKSTAPGLREEENDLVPGEVAKDRDPAEENA
jgi:hypothetical protein